MYAQLFVYTQKSSRETEEEKKRKRTKTFGSRKNFSGEYLEYWQSEPNVDISIAQLSVKQSLLPDRIFSQPKIYICNQRASKLATTEV